MSYFKSVTQNVIVDSNNSSTENLTAGSTFTPLTAGGTSTLGVAAIQVSFKADKNCTITVEQSPDTTPNWDIVDTFYYFAGQSFGRTVQAINSWVRVTVTNVDVNTTSYLRLQTCLCPIAEPLPRSLNTLGYQKNGQFFQDIAQSDIPFVKSWSKIGYSPTVNSTESDIWSLAGTYGNGGLFPAAAVQMEIVGSENTNDIGTIIKGNRATPVTSDAGGSTTTLVDANGGFLSATAVAIGDILICDPSGITSPNIPEWGIVTGVSDTELTFAGGLSKGGTGTTRKYLVLDTSAHSGALAFKIDYLTASYNEATLIIPANGTTAVATLADDGSALTNLFRINSFRMIAAGSGNKPTGDWRIRTVSAGTTWSYITAGFTRARNHMYTVPAGHTLYVTQWNAGWSSPGDAKTTTARLFTRANVEPTTMFNTGNIFYPYTELIITNQQTEVTFPIPTRLPAKTDIKVSGLAVNPGTGPCTSVLRGYLVG